MQAIKMKLPIMKSLLEHKMKQLLDLISYKIIGANISIAGLGTFLLDMVEKHRSATLLLGYGIAWLIAFIVKNKREKSKYEAEEKRKQAKFEAEEKRLEDLHKEELRRLSIEVDDYERELKKDDLPEEV